MCDEDGWSYAPSIEILEEDISKGTATGSASTLSMVRRRRHTRSRVCVSSVIRETIKRQMKLLHDQHAMLESTLKNRQSEFIELKDYEKARISRCKTGYFLINGQVSRCMLTIKDYREKLLKLSVFLTEVNEIESKYAEKLRHVGSSLRCERGARKVGKDRVSELSSNFPIESPREGDVSNNFSIRIPEVISEECEENDMSSQEDSLATDRSRRRASDTVDDYDGSSGGNFPTFRRRCTDDWTLSPKSPSLSSWSAPSHDVPSAMCVSQFFEKMGGSYELIGEYHRNFADILNTELITDVNECLAYISDTYIKSKTAWKDRRETYRVFEDAVKAAYRGMDVAYQYACASLVSKLSNVKAELETRRSGGSLKHDVEFQHSNSTSSNVGSLYRKDVWLQVLLYHQALGDIEHGVSALVNFMEEIQAVFDHISIKVKAVFLVVTQQFSNAQRNSWKSSSDALGTIVQELLDSEFEDREFLYEHSSDNARTDVSTMEVLLHYYKDRQILPRSHEWDTYVTLPSVPSSSSVAASGYLLYMPTSHCAKPNHAQFLNPDRKLHEEVVAPVDNRDDTFIGQRKFWVIVKAVRLSQL